MRTFQIRWKNFRSFRDTAPLTIRPLTIVLGANASGKTSLIAPLLLLKQTIESKDASLALATQGPLFDAGVYSNLIRAHVTERTLTLDLRFQDETSPSTPKPAPAQPPARLELGFCCAQEGLAPLLKTYAVRDWHGQLMLRRRRLRDGSYSLAGPCAPQHGGAFYRAIRRSRPAHFYFDVEGVFREMYAARSKRSHKGVKPQERQAAEDSSEPQIRQSEELYFSTVTHSATDVQGLLQGIAYLGPLRERPKRLYEALGERPATAGVRGEFAPEILFRHRGKPLLQRVNSWVERFELGFQLEPIELTQGAFSIRLGHVGSSAQVNLADTGFGLSQVLPLIVQGLYGPQNSLLIAEQPEIHLNPRLQTLLADLFVAVASRGVTTLVETHSEYLVLRLRRLIAEGVLDPKRVALYFVERLGEESTIRQIALKRSGHMEVGEWPKGFFEDSLRESLALAAAQTARKSDV